MSFWISPHALKRRLAAKRRLKKQSKSFLNFRTHFVREFTPGFFGRRGPHFSTEAPHLNSPSAAADVRVQV
jgi:hypothetical protein